MPLNELDCAFERTSKYMSAKLKVDYFCLFLLSVS